MKAIILAGGLGERLQPFTQVIPKPLLPIGESSVLEIQALALKASGFKKIFIATNYMAEYVQAFVGDGKKYGVDIVYSREDKPLGTCGPIMLLKDQLDEPFLLMNGDILTTLDFSLFYDFAVSTDADLTVATTEIAAPFDFGKVTTQGDYIIDVEEKPNFRLEILAGIYLIKPPLLEIVPPGVYYGIDTLLKDMLKRKMKIARYQLRDYWLDIGHMNDYNLAQDAYRDHFSEIIKSNRGNK